MSLNMFGFLWNITKLQYLSVYTWMNYKVTGKVSLPLIKKCKNEILNSGFVVIKLCQWSLPRLHLIYNLENEAWFKELENVYDNCYIHDINYTKELYTMTTGVEFDKKYKILNVVASGSIGQVYKVRDKETQQIKALKCKHPGTNLHYKLSIFIIRAASLFLTSIKRIHYRIFPVDLGTFFKSLNAQVYLSNEANNLTRMHDNFKDNEYIMVPKLYEYNDEILVMEYIEGIKYQDLNISNNNKGKISFLLFLLLRQMIVVDKFVHGDLHKGNWKVVIDTSQKETKYKIVLYDVGFCLSFDFMTAIFEAIEENNTDKIAGISPYIITDVFNRDIGAIKKIISSDMQKHFVRPIGNKDLINSVLITCKENGFILEGFFISMAIVLEQVSSLFDEFLINKNAEIRNTQLTDDREIFTEVMLKKDYPDVISFCQTYDIFPKLVEYYYKRIEKEGADMQRTSIFEGSDFSDIIDTSLALME